MRLLLIIVGIVSATILFGASAGAQNAPWCMQSSTESSQRCIYATFQQCSADRVGTEFCIQNSTYQPSTPTIRRR
jgi:hypothetical protein